jgi:hypothetical protein
VNQPRNNSANYSFKWFIGFREKTKKTIPYDHIDLGEVDVSKNNYDKESVIEYSPLCNG